jgi:hypothetical protein
MANFTLSVAVSGLGVPTVAYRATERGRLKSIACGYEAISPDWGRLYVMIGTMLGGLGLEYMTALFYQGYISIRHFGFWTGDYPFDSYEDVFVWGYSSVARTVRIVGKVESMDC